MSVVCVPALKSLIYQGRTYVRGELVTVEAIEAAAMARRGEVSLSIGETIDPDPIETPRRRRAYRRRDMTAEK